MGTQYALADRDPTKNDLVKYALPASALFPISIDAQNEALLAASELLDSHMRDQFTLPLQTWGTDVRRAVCHVAAYDLMVTRGFDPGMGRDDVIEKRHDLAMQWFRDIAKGMVVPDVVDSSGSPDVGGSNDGHPEIITSTSRGFSSRGSGRRGGSFTGD